MSLVRCWYPSASALKLGGPVQRGRICPSGLGRHLGPGGDLLSQLSFVSGSNRIRLAIVDASVPGRQSGGGGVYSYAPLRVAGPQQIWKDADAKILQIAGSTFVGKTDTTMYYTAMAFQPLFFAAPYSRILLPLIQMILSLAYLAIWGVIAGMMITDIPADFVPTQEIARLESGEGSSCESSDKFAGIVERRASCWVIALHLKLGKCSWWHQWHPTLGAMQI
eukprot:Skav218468  [mRNA]  locus=scaffold538:956938:959022:+ [translate_table: standard]